MSQTLCLSSGWKPILVMTRVSLISHWCSGWRLQQRTIGECVISIRVTWSVHLRYSIDPNQKATSLRSFCAQTRTQLPTLRGGGAETVVENGQIGELSGDGIYGYPAIGSVPWKKVTHRKLRGQQFLRCSIQARSNAG